MTSHNGFFSGFKSGMDQFGSILTVIINTVLLTIVYIIGVGVTSILAKVSGKKFLQLQPSQKKSYWQNLNLKKKNIEEYYKQF